MQLSTPEPDVFIRRQTAQTSNNFRRRNTSRDVYSVLEQRLCRFQHQLHFLHPGNDLWQFQMSDRGRHRDNKHPKCRSFDISNCIHSTCAFLLAPSPTRRSLNHTSFSFTDSLANRPGLLPGQISLTEIQWAYNSDDPDCEAYRTPCNRLHNIASKCFLDVAEHSRKNPETPSFAKGKSPRLNRRTLPAATSCRSS